MFERKHERLLPAPQFAVRLLNSLLLASCVVVVALTIGTLGYHSIARLSWVDAILNASMILTGMGPVDPMETTASKLFASAFALFSGVVFLSAVGLVLSPIFHRILHRFHLDDTQTPPEAVEQQTPAEAKRGEHNEQRTGCPRD